MKKRNRPGRRERERRRSESRLPELKAELARMPDGPDAARIRSEIARAELAKAARRLKKLPKPDSVPMPESYVAELKEKQEAAHKVSGFGSIRAHFVQGGSPGTGRRS